MGLTVGTTTIRELIKPIMELCTTGMLRSTAGILPSSGWHVPSLEEFTVLTNYLGGRDVAGDKLKESGTNHWLAPNNGTNESGFTGLPGGGRGWYWSETSGLGENGYFWTTTSKDAGTAWFRWLPTGDSAGFFLSNEEMPAGNSVRCLRD